MAAKRANESLRKAARIPSGALGWAPPTAPARGSSGRQEGKTPGDGLTSPKGDGRGATQATGRATGNRFNPSRDPKSAEGRAAGQRNFNEESRSPSQARGGPPPAASDVSAQHRAQGAPRPASERLRNTLSIPADGMTHGVPAYAPPWRSGTGSVGNSSRPFKGLK